jgi:hypothetical protein
MVEPWSWCPSGSDSFVFGNVELLVCQSGGYDMEASVTSSDGDLVAMTCATRVGRGLGRSAGRGAREKTPSVNSGHFVRRYTSF